MCQVLSHVADPVSAVASARSASSREVLFDRDVASRRLLTPGPAGRRWHVISPPTVVWLETSASIRGLLDRVGLDVVGWTRGRKTVSLGLVASILDERALLGPLAGAARRLATRRGASLVYPFADLVWVTAAAPR